MDDGASFHYPSPAPAKSGGRVADDPAGETTLSYRTLQAVSRQGGGSALGRHPPAGGSRVTGVLVYFDAPAPPNCIPNCSASERRSTFAQFSQILPLITL